MVLAKTQLGSMSYTGEYHLHMRGCLGVLSNDDELAVTHSKPFHPLGFFFPQDELVHWYGLYILVISRLDNLMGV